MMKRLLVTGASGMLGAALVNELSDAFDIYATGNSNFERQYQKYLKFDLAEESYDRLIEWSNPDIVIHCAALTDGNECEKDPIRANLINGISVEKILLSTSNRTRIIYISTDAVFPSSLSMASESDGTSPQSSYGKSKELGERILLKSGRNHQIIRTTIIGSNQSLEFVGCFN